MNYLLDTHTFIWYLNGAGELSQKAKERIEEETAINFISIASLWEIAIKTRLGKIEINRPFELLETLIYENGFQLLPINFNDTLVITKLPLHHRDPFDRILIAQCMNHNLMMISRDPIFRDYMADVLW